MNSEWFDSAMRIAINVFQLAFAILVTLGVLASVAGFVVKRIRGAFAQEDNDKTPAHSGT